MTFSSLRCDLCAAEPAYLIVGEVETGQQRLIGADCLPMWHLASAESLLGLAALAETIGARLTAEAATPEEKPPRQRRGKRSPVEDVTSPAPAPAERAGPETAATAPDS